MASVMASCMCRIRMAAGLGIDSQGVPDHLFPKVTAQIHRRPQIDSPASEQPAELVLDVRQAKETDMCVLLEFNQHVNITGFGKTISENGTEQSEFPDTVALAYPGNLRFRDLHVCDRHASQYGSPVPGARDGMVLVD